MPIAELLGVQFDMQLLLKLSLSVATVLLVSWAYRFYSSRSTEEPPLYVKETPDGETQEPTNGTCQNCKTPLQPQSTARHHADDEDERPRPSQTDADTDNLTPHNTDGRSREEAQPCLMEDTGGSQSTEENTDPDQDTSMDVTSHVGQTEVTDSNTPGSTLNLPSVRESGLATPTGRRSPCYMQRLECSVGVGRELRQDLEHQGAHSIFLSKAEITVADANLVHGETGGQIVRGKIYDYYVESSSQFIRDPKATLQQRERQSSDSEELGSHSCSRAASPVSFSHIIMRDLSLLQSTAEDPLPPVSPEPRPPARPVLLRKESYLTAAEHSELPIHTPKASTPVSHSQGSSCDERSSASPVMSPFTDNKGSSPWEEPSLETVAGAPFLHLPTEKLSSVDFERLKGKLDLGNCMEVLGLAKKHGHPLLQQAALRVMSDNYLQVLREPSLFGRLMAGEREQIQRQRMRGRRFVVVADMDPQDWPKSAGRQATEAEPRRASSGLYYYDDYKDVWHPLCSIPQEVISRGCAICTMDNYLFVAVGCQGTEREMIPSKRVFCYNPVTSIWKEISPMNEARPHCKLAALHGYVYAIGGECLSTVERYDPRTDRWTFVASLPNDTFAVAHHAAVCNGEIFVSGGTLRYTLLRYNPKTNAWRLSPMVGSKDRTAQMVAVRSFLYRFDVNALLGVSVFRYHTVARLWYQCSAKRLLHCPSFQCVAMDDTIYCVSQRFTMTFRADDVSPGFLAEDLSVLPAAKGILLPLVLSLPDKKPLQTRV